MSMVSTVPETPMISSPGAGRISSVTTFYEISLDNQDVGNCVFSVTTFDDDLSVLRSIKQADAQPFISVDYLWAGMSIAIMRARTHNRNFRSHSG